MAAFPIAVICASKTRPPTDSYNCLTKDWKIQCTFQRSNINTDHLHPLSSKDDIQVDAITRESTCLLCSWAWSHPRREGGQETALPSSQSSPTLANCLEEQVFLTKRKAKDVATKDGQLDQSDNCILRHLIKSLQ